MIDPRIVKYRDIAAAMKKGMFDFEIPAGPEDEIGQLGQTLLELGHALKKQFDQLIELNQMKNGFLGIAAHDLRSPIAIIMNYVEYLLEGHPGKRGLQPVYRLWQNQRSANRR